MAYEMVRFNEENLGEALEVLSEAFKRQDGTKKSFAEMYPRIFGPEAERIGDNFCAMKNGEVVGCISNDMMEYHVGDEVLKISSSGNVAVKASERGQGLMKVMFDCVHQDLIDGDFDLSYLHGARTRYNYFGYELCGIEYIFKFEMADLSKHYKNRHMFEFVDLRERTDLLEEAIKINEMQKVYIKRRAESLVNVFLARWRQPVAVLRDGELFGTFAFGENGIKYITLRDYKDFAEMVFEFLSAKGLDATEYWAPDYNKELMANCMKNCSSFVIGNPANFKIMHFEKVVKAFLQLKADNEALCDGEITLDSDLFGKFRIAITNGKVSVNKFEGEACYRLKGFQVYDFLFNHTPISYGPYDPAVSSWLPIPINSPYLA